MPIRPARLALVLSVTVAAIVLAVAPLLAAAEGSAQVAGPAPADQYDGDTSPHAPTAVARTSHRDNVLERAAQDRTALIGVLVALVGATALSQRAQRIAQSPHRSGHLWASPFSGRSPPVLTA